MERGNINTMLVLSVEGQQISGRDAPKIKRIIGSEEPSLLALTFSDDWENYNKWAVFRKRFSEDRYQVLLTENGCVIPDAIFADDDQFIVGVYGELDGKRKPTTWSPLITIVRVRNNDS